MYRVKTYIGLVLTTEGRLNFDECIGKIIKGLFMPVFKGSLRTYCDSF